MDHMKFKFYCPYNEVSQEHSHVYLFCMADVSFCALTKEVRNTVLWTGKSNGTYYLVLHCCSKYDLLVELLKTI